MNTITKTLSTLLASSVNPPNFPTTITPRTGKITAVIKNPITLKKVLLPDYCPNKGGNIKLPAPKNNENNIKLIITKFFLLSFISPSPMTINYHYFIKFRHYCQITLSII